MCPHVDSRWHKHIHAYSGPDKPFHNVSSLNLEGRQHLRASAPCFRRASLHLISHMCWRKLEAYVYAQMRKIGIAVISAGRVDYRCGWDGSSHSRIRFVSASHLEQSIAAIPHLGAGAAIRRCVGPLPTAAQRILISAIQLALP